MSSLIETVRKEISGGDPPLAELAQSESELIAVVTRDSLGALIASALASRKQGRMSDAISQITRANRAQLDAIESIMRTLDRVFERPRNEVIFAKYRQTYPFEMGIENADDVIVLVQAFHRDIPPNGFSKTERLHNLEAARAEEAEALEFFGNRFRDGGAEAEIEEVQGKLLSIVTELEEIKSAILGAVISVVFALLNKLRIGRMAPSAEYEISGWLYQIVTSKTLTKAAKNVEVH
jgi:hypothetical protein